MGKKINRKYKDTIFRMLFGDKRELLALYNAIHGTDYTDPEALEIVTLKNAIYMGMKNDIAYVLDMRLSLVEHQSTVNYNMPLRMLLYIGDLYKKLFRKRNLYAKRRISLPMPEFFVFYNGVEDQPERLTMRLSDAYTHAGADVNLELVVVQLNINPGYNEELKKKCPALTGYAYFVSRVREYRERMELEEAIELAVDDCIEHDILKEFMLKNGEEVKKMGISIYHYDREEHMRIMEEEAREDGMEQG
ncbi:MAG: hypothetical protein IJ733_19605, partial [Lachnospiraceae bacterium]|nr:hypothetical protein [Lachnospiraceae bacterium]